MLLPANSDSSSGDSRPTASSARQVPPLPGGSETILLVEDEDAVRDFTGRVLKLCGYSVIEARNGREALEITTDMASPIDLLLTDAVMPLMVGGELARSLRVTRPQLKVLYMSGFTDDEVVRRGLL